MNTAFKMATSMPALFSIFPVLVTRVNLDTCRCVWTGKFDLNMDACGHGNFLNRKEKVADLKNILIRVDAVLFAIKLEKLLVNDKIANLGQTSLSPMHNIKRYKHTYEL